MQLGVTNIKWVNRILTFLFLGVFSVLVAQPEVTVKGNGFEILDGAVTWPDSTGQSFGVAQANVDAVTKTYWIYNTGDAPLTLSNFRVTAVYNTHFDITTPANLIVAAGDSVSFDVKYAPTSAGTHGRTTGGSGVCVAAFDTDDANEPKYDFRISGVATADPAFDCSTGRMFFSHLGGGTDLKEWNYGDQPPTLTTISNALTWNHDGMALNPNDNYIYTVRYNGGSRNQLWVLSSTGIANFVGYISGAGITNTMAEHASAGAMDNNNNLYAFYNADATSSLRKINVKSQLAESITLSDPIHIRGAIYNPEDGLLYGFSAGATHDGLVSVDPNDGTVNYIGGDGDLTYAAMFRSADGSVYMMSQTYSMYLVDLKDGSIEQIGTNPGWGNGNWVDGCACGEIKAEADVNITVDDNRPSYVPGQFQTYIITVTNNGPWGTYRDTIKAGLPAGITEMSWTSTAYGAGITDNSSGSGALEDVVDIGVGDSIVYRVKVTVPLGYSGDLTSATTVATSSVLSDPDLSNNTASDSDVIVTSASEQCDNGFDDDGDGMVDCFDGDCFGNSLCSDGFFGLVPPECQEAPPVTSTFNMVEKYRNTNADDYTQALVADMDGDGIPEIFSYNASNQLYLINGEDGSTQTTMSLTHTQFSQGAGIADVDRDGFAEIFMLEAGVGNRRLHRFDHNGNLVYSGDQFGQGGVVAWDQQHTVSPSFADFNEDGFPEIYMGNNIFDPATGKALVKGAYGAAKGTHMNWWQQYSVAYDILPDDFCGDCDGMELICGNTVYSVNNTTFALNSVSTHPRGDGYTALADLNQDGEMDIIVATGNNNGSYIYVWDPRTGLIVPTDSKGNPLPAFLYLGGDYGGAEENLFSIPTVADFDGDGINEIGIITPFLLTILEPDLSIGAQLVTTDESGATTMTSFDFEGDGEMEIVYRDQTNLRVLKYDTLTGTIVTKSSTPCGSGTRTEGPVVADVDADGEAEICISCRGSGGGGDYLGVFESDSTRSWMPARKVWNQHNYVPIWVNDDLTIPATFQDKNSIPGQDIFLSQTPLTDSLGNLIFPALPDFVVAIDSTTLGDCIDDSMLVYLTVCNDDAPFLIYDYPISFYDGDPTIGGTLLLTRTVTVGNSRPSKDSCYHFSFNVPHMPINLFVFANDNGTGEFGYPTTLIEECDSSNNSTNAQVGCPYDAGITKDDGELHYIPGGARTYEIVARNNGPSFTGGVVSDPLPSGISNGDITWTATTYGGATTTASGTMNGALQDTVNIPGGDSIVYSVTISTPDNLTGDLVNVVSINLKGDSIPDNNTASDTDTIDCTFAIAATVNSKHSSWTQIGTVVGGFTYNFSTTGGTKTFTPGSGPESGQQITTVVYNTGTGYSVSLSRHRYNGTNAYNSTLTHYDDTPHGWTGLSGSGYEKAPVLGFMAFVDKNGNGSYDSGIDDFIRDINTLSITPVNSGELYLAFYDDGVYTDNNGLINIESSIDPLSVDLTVSDTLICDGDSIQLDAGNPGALNWDWSNGESNQTIQAKMSGEYSVIVTTPGGCQAVDTINLIFGCETDLQASKTDGLSSYTRGANTVYTIVAKNNGPLDVQDATVFDTIPNGVNSFSWTATLYGTASNTSGLAGSGAISDLVDLAVGDSIVYTVTAAVSTYKFGELANMVTIFTPEGREDSDSTNNIAIDIDADPDPTSCFIMMTDFEDYVNCTAPSYNDFTAAYAGNSVWVNSNHTAGLFVDNPGTCTNIPGGNILPDPDGGTAYAGLHSPLSGNPNKQEVIIGTLPTSLLANQEYEISFLSVSMNIWGDATWDNYGEIDFFGIAEGTSPTLDLITQENWTTISAIPEVDHLGTSATITNRADWEEYAFKFTPTRDLDRLLLAPRGDWTFIGIDNIVVKVASPALKIDTLTICEGSITDTVIAYTITSGNPGEYSIDWDVAANDAGISDVAQTTLPVLNQFIFSGLDLVPVGNYTAKISTFNTLLGCEKIDSILFIVNANPTVNLGNDTTLCADSTIVLNAGNTDAESWVWSTGETQQTIVTKTAEQYSVVVTGANNCVGEDEITIDYNIPPSLSLGSDTTICTGESIIFSVNTPENGSQLWNTGSSEVSITADTIGSYTVTLTDSNGCINRGTVNLTLYPLPDVNIVNDTTTCAGDTIDLIATADYTNYEWTNNASTTNTASVFETNAYKLTVTSEDGCKASETTLVTVNPIPEIGLDDSTHYCVYGPALVLSVLESGADYVWSTGSTDQEIEILIAGEYWVDVTNDNNCFNTDTITIRSPYLTIELGDKASICDEDSIILDAGDFAFEVWNSTDTSATFIVNQTNTIDVLAVNADGCYGRDTIDITKNSNPTITIIQTDSVICDLIGETTTLSVTDDEGMEINWNTGASGENITVIENGEFIATKTNEFGCFASDTVMIDRLCEEITITLPNIFTPDGDGTNENFKPIEDPLQLLTYIDVISFIVYNRWGRTMHLSENLLPHWNGLYQDSGEPCPDGVYYWVMKYSNVQGEEKSKNGYVHLIR